MYFFINGFHSIKISSYSILKIKYNNIFYCQLITVIFAAIPSRPSLSFAMTK